MKPEPRLDDSLAQARRHSAHRRRELYEHNLDEPCPCDGCQRAAFEHRAVTIALALVIGCALAAWLFLAAQ